MLPQNMAETQPTYEPEAALQLAQSSTNTALHHWHRELFWCAIPS
jgi:hypothetical protein